MLALRLIIDTSVLTAAARKPARSDVSARGSGKSPWKLSTLLSRTAGGTACPTMAEVECTSSRSRHECRDGRLKSAPPWRLRDGSITVAARQAVVD